MIPNFVDTVLKLDESNIKDAKAKPSRYLLYNY